MNVFFAPTQAFDDLVEKVNWRDWVFPLLFLSVVFAVLPRFYQDVKYRETLTMIQKQEQRFGDNPNISDDQRAKLQARFDKARQDMEAMHANPWQFKYLWGYALLPVYLFIVFAIWAGALMIAGNFGMGGKSGFFQVFTVVALSYYVGGNGMLIQMPEGIGALEIIVKAPIILAKDTTHILFSPGLFMDVGNSFLSRFLNQFDLFRLWSVAVLGIGFAKLYKRSLSTGIWTVFAFWLIFTVMGTGLAGLFGAR